MKNFAVPVKATSDQYDEITEVWEASVRATHHFLSEDDIAHFKPLVRHTYLDMVDLYVISSEELRITGFVGLSENKIEMLFLDPAYRGRGLGKHLLRFAVDSLGATLVDVNEDNAYASEFYQRMGFRVTSRSPLDPNGKPFPILHMSL